MSRRRFPPDDPERRRWQDPERVLAAIGVAPGMTFLDVGCGEGYFALPAARRVGASGLVCGIDINGEAVTRLRHHAAEAGMDWVSARAGAAEETVLCSGCGDVVFFGISLHDFSDPGKVLRNARRMVRHGGILADLDWHAREMPFGPPPEKRFPPEHAMALIREAGFHPLSLQDCGPYHYLILARPAP
ncbi:MAG: methyltransferase domain-containing protein [Methanomicrobiales archaeon]|nr:methyltransferase domain-containing protein [Methanomicrobiales archaeon]MDD1660048.1 methyltransferase domain-containing protein [Methanomicrobiales archaeon]